MPRSSAVSRAGRAAWINDMFQAYAEARFTDAANLFNKHTREAPLEAAVLQARISLKNGNAPETIGLLSSRRSEDKAKQAEILMLLAAAHARLDQFSESDEEFDRAAHLAKVSRNRDLSAEIAYRRAVRFVQQGHHAEAQRELIEARNGPSRRSQIYAIEGESFLLASQARYTDQARLLTHLLEDIDPQSSDFPESRAWATHTLAVLARELPIPRVVPLVERHLEAGHWTCDLTVNRFQGLKAVGWAHALRGDYFNAFRYLKRSLTTAPSPQWVAMALADRAYLALCIGEPRWSRQELAEAEDVAADVDWTSAKGEEVFALLLLAELFVAAEPSRAAYYLARFDELGDVRNRLLHFRNDARPKHLAEYSRGLVEIGLGNKKRGLHFLASAETFFTEVRYDWRAGRCALDQYQVTRDPVHLQRASARLRDYTSSWLGDRLRDLSRGPAAGVRLPPMQQKVFDGICRGLSNAEIAKEMRRSEFTVANHVKVLLRTFGVPSRSALLAEAVRRNLV